MNGFSRLIRKFIGYMKKIENFTHFIEEIFNFHLVAYNLRNIWQNLSSIAKILLVYILELRKKYDVQGDHHVQYDHIEHYFKVFWYVFVRYWFMCTIWTFQYTLLCVFWHIQTEFANFRVVMQRKRGRNLKLPYLLLFFFSTFWTSTWALVWL